MIPLLATLASVVLISLLIIRTLRPTSDRCRNIPGPWRLPIIGNLHQFLRHGSSLPHVVLRDLARAHGPDLMRVKLGQLDLIIASSSRAAREILKTHDADFANRPPFAATTIISYGNKDIAFAPYGAYWRQLRKICVLELLSSRRVRASFGVRRDETMRLVDDLTAAGPSRVINLSKELMLLSNATTARIAFGAKCRQGERFIKAGKKVLALGSGFNLADLFPSGGIVDMLTGASRKVRKFHRETDAVLGEIIEEHQARRAAADGRGRGDGEEELEDLVDVLLSLQEKGGLGFPLTVTNIKAVIFDMFLGGTETTATAMEWTMAELMRHPELMNKVQSEIRLALKGKAEIESEDLSNMHNLKIVIKESLRLHPPFTLILPRTCPEPRTVLDYNVPAGSKVFVNNWAIGRDAKFWGDGDRFRPERFDECPVDYTGDSFDFLPFGAGRRMCPGQAFAVASIELVLALLLYYFDWELPDGMKPEELDMTESLGATIGRKSELCLLARPHSS